MKLSSEQKQLAFALGSIYQQIGFGDDDRLKLDELVIKLLDAYQLCLNAEAKDDIELDTLLGLIIMLKAGMKRDPDKGLKLLAKVIHTIIFGEEDEPT